MSKISQLRLYACFPCSCLNNFSFATYQHVELTNPRKRMHKMKNFLLVDAMDINIVKLSRNTQMLRWSLSN